MFKDKVAIVLVVLTVAICVFTAPRFCYSGDPYWMRLQAWSWLHGRGDVPYDESISKERGQYCFYNERDGKYYSKYGVMNSVFFMAPVVIYNMVGGYGCSEDSDRLFVAVSNGFNLLWAISLALILYKTALLFTEDNYLAALWAWLNLFSGFGWNYLRAQTGEIFQWTLASVLFYLLFRFIREREDKRIVAGIWLSLFLLILTKSVYVLFLPICIVLCFVLNRTELKKINFWYPLIVICFIFLSLNYWRFGSPFNNGYSQWNHEANLFGGNIFEGIYGFLFSSDRSIFIHYPILLISLVAWKKFYREYKDESLLTLGVFLLFLLVNSKFISWAGHWCYGPRFLLFILAQMSLPSLCLFDYIRSHWNKISVKLSVVPLILILGSSFYLQIQVNSLNFFTYYQVESCLRSVGATRALEEYHRLPFGVINVQLNNFKEKGTPPHWLNTAYEEAPGTAWGLSQTPHKFIEKNYFWF
ncbi:hypothetical protein IJT10_05135 [bacterium]|nr:hypothetical protein [bacterium]